MALKGQACLSNMAMHDPPKRGFFRGGKSGVSGFTCPTGSKGSSDLPHTTLTDC